MGFKDDTRDELWEDVILVAILNSLTPPTHPPSRALRGHLRDTELRLLIVGFWGVLLRWSVSEMIYEMGFEKIPTLSRKLITFSFSS